MNTFNYPQYFYLLDQSERVAVEQVTSGLIAIESSIGLRWGGSTPDLLNRTELSDVDLWLLVQDGTELRVRNEVASLSARLNDVVFVFESGPFEFFGHLVSLFFFDGCSFGVDVGVCTTPMLEAATPGKSSVLVWGTWPQPQPHWGRRNGPPADRRLGAILANLVKVRKALHRGYYWNAIEYTSRARRQLMGLLVGDGPTKELRYSRSDHSVEGVMSEADLRELSVTSPHYSQADIAECASRVGRISIRWAEERGIEWMPLAQLKIVTDSIQVTAANEQAQGINSVPHRGADT
jgi:hypothetical protein